MLALLVLAATMQINVDNIKADINKGGYSWIAGETKFTKMTTKERAKYLLDEQPVPPKIVSHAILSVVEEMSVPYEFDWLAYQSPVKDQ